MGKDNKVLTPIDRTVSVIETSMLVISGVMLFSMVAFVSLGVLGRVFSFESAWNVELAEYTLVFMTFLSASWVLKNDGHVIVDIVLVNVKDKMRRVMEIITFFIVFILCTILFYYSLKVTVDHFQRGIIMYNITMLPKYIVLLPLPVGSFLLTVRAFLEIFRRKDINKERNLEASL